MRDTVGLPVGEPSQASEARRIAERAGLDEVGRGRVALVRPRGREHPAGSLPVLRSDGLTTRRKLDRASPLASRHPASIAGALDRDFARDRDDSTVVIAVEGRSKPS